MVSSPPSIPRPPSRSERLLRDTLRRDETRRAHPRSSSSSRGADDADDDDLFQSAILSRCSSRRNSAASALGHPHPAGFYIPGQDEHASYSRLLRSSSYSGSSRSAQSDPRSSPYVLEKQAEFLRHEPAPHEAVLRNRLDSVMHSMRIDKDRDLVDSPTASLASSIGSLSNSRAYSNESHHSHQTHLTVPDPDPSTLPAPRPKRVSPNTHRQTQSASVAHARSTSPSRTSVSPRASTQSPRSPRAHQSPKSPPRTPTQRDKERRQHPDSPWVYPPLPPSPPVYSTSPSKRAGPAVVTFVANPPMVEARSHIPAYSPDRHSPMPPSSFDPEAASHALRQLPGYVSFASVAGLGVPPEEEDRRSGRRPFTNFTPNGKGRLSGLGLGGGKWWIF